MPGKVVFWTPAFFAITGSIVVLLSGDRFQITTYTFTIGPLGFVAIWVIGLGVLHFVYRWLLQHRKPRHLFWLHFASTFIGLGGFLYMLLPVIDDGQTLISMLSYLGWAFVAAFLILLGTMSMLVLIIREILARIRTVTNNPDA